MSLTRNHSALIRDGSFNLNRVKMRIKVKISGMFPLLLTLVFAVFAADAAAAAAAAAAAVPPPLTCEMNRTADGYLYHLSRGFDRSRCNTAWADRNGFVIARRSRLNLSLASSLTDQSITMRDCWEHLHFSKDNLDCPGSWEEAHCKVNCSVLLEPLNHVTNKSCIAGSWCPEEHTVGLLIGSVVVLVAVFFGGLWIYRFCKHKRDAAAKTARFSSISQDERIQMQRDAGDQRKDVSYDMVPNNSS